MDTFTVVLNLFELEIGTTLFVFGDEMLTLTSQEIRTETQRVAFTFAKTFLRGAAAILRITFRGSLQSFPEYYKSEWINQGKAEHYSATFLELTYARRVLPCWDEPALKAMFAVSPISRVETVNLSNMPSFLRVATPNLIAQAEFSVNLVTHVLPLLEQMFDLEYPLPKMDILNTTGALGALENWGLVVGEPNVFWFNPAKDSTATQKHMVDITSHELAHQWFGNIVTMEWWDNLVCHAPGRYHLRFFSLCLRVRDDTEMYIYSTDKLYPEWNTAAAVVNGTFKIALNVDARLSSHPVQLECPDANHVNEVPLERFPSFFEVNIEC
ncbi:peptidase family M1-domain-containing protein [Mycena rosella]|uniref:Peptidase family M1-domain-containing protein n=1 Tax=Mycena rosella TaxID=1033263 RepID=A0AAD7FGJ2_MYCRO|nr:peptidase family M1-domain-containing protein [Mycena rosella]